MPRKQTKQRRPPRSEKMTVPPAVEPSAGPDATAVLPAEERRRMIAEAAYFRAERRGFAVGSEVEDWLAAEGEIDRSIELGGSRSRHSAQHM